MNHLSGPSREKIEKVLEELRPMLKADGGDIELVAVHPDGVIQVHLVGICADCTGPMMALREGLSKVIREQVPEVREVRAV
jgi:Fe-S cluster biogenesis protein NfuA